MRSVTPAFLGALAGTHRIVTQVDVLFNRQAVVEDLAVVAGSVTLDGTALIRGRCNVTFAEPGRVPTDAGDPLSPFGFELKVRRGIRYRDGSTELVGLGVFPIQSSQVDGVSLASQISTMDRGQLVSDARFEDDYQVAAGTNYATAIQAMISTAVDGLEYSFSSTTLTTPLLVFEAQADRWAAAQSMATSIGYELFFDGDGRCVLRPEPDPSYATPVWTAAEGQDGVLVSAALSLDRAQAYNRVIAYSSNSSLTAVFRGVATDDDPASPTYYFGGFGRKPSFYASPLIASTAQATAAAEGLLRRRLGVAKGLSFTSVPNPALEPGDVTLVRRAALGIDEAHVVDSLTVGLGAEAAMSADTRVRQEIAA